jgi:hypothetical protein
MRILFACLLAVAVTAPHPAFAWGDEGHESIALVAGHYLDPAARAKMAMLLSADTETLTGHDIASEATWQPRMSAGQLLEVATGTEVRRLPAGGKRIRTIGPAE